MDSIKLDREEGIKKAVNMSDYTISIKAYQIFDSCGFPTVGVKLHTSLGAFHAAVPSDASTGDYEALELRYKPKEFRGSGVNKVLTLINDVIGPALINAKYAIIDQEGIDKFLKDMDGTKNMSKLGVNATLGISMAVCMAGAAAKNVPLWQHIADLAGTKQIMLPVPAFNVIYGGKDTSNGMIIQEFMIMPVGAKSFSEAMQYGTDCYHNLKHIIIERFGAQASDVSDEGGFTPKLQTSKEALCLIQEVIERSCLGNKMQIAIDVAASTFYTAEGEVRPHHMQPEQLGNVYKELIAEFPICSIEHPFHKEDWKAWQQFKSETIVQIVCDELTATNPERIAKAIELKACDCLLLKMSQFGTVTESIGVHLMAKKNGWGTIVSLGTGETEDTFIADLVVGLSAGQFKCGAPCRGERVFKYNRLIRIERELGDMSRYAGNCYRSPK